MARYFLWEPSRRCLGAAVDLLVVLFLVYVVGVVFALRRFLKAPPEARRREARWLVVVGVGFVALMQAYIWFGL